MSTQKYTREQIAEFKAAFDAQQKPNYLGTKFLKKRGLIVISLFLILLIFTAFIPESDSEITIINYFFFIPFLLLIAFIDQIIFGWYLFYKIEKGNEVIE